MKRSIAVLAMTVGLSSAASVQAAEVAGHPVSTTVLVSQADLRDPAAVKSLYGRLARAAEAVCTTGAIGRFVAQGSDQACVQDALDSAVGKVDRPLLTALHQARTPTTAFARRN